jgi:hypothetical protein
MSLINTNGIKKFLSGERTDSFDQNQIDALHGMSGKDKLNFILKINNPDAFVKSLPMLDLFRIFHDIGIDSVILQLASPEQVRFILDLEIWEGWSISIEETEKWFEALLDTGDKHAVSVLSQLDLEMLLIFLKKNMSVGGGLSNIINSEDYQGEWEHTFDEVFYLNFFEEESKDLILRMLGLLFNEHYSLYRSLMLGVENELLTELEEIAWQFRSGRLADEGLPATATATSVLERTK